MLLGGRHHAASHDNKTSETSFTQITKVVKMEWVGGAWIAKRRGRGGEEEEEEKRLGSREGLSLGVEVELAAVFGARSEAAGDRRTMPSQEHYVSTYIHTI